jgi:hypothetical protein
MSLWLNVRRWHGSPGPAQEGAGQTGLCSQSNRNTRQAADVPVTLNISFSPPCLTTHIVKLQHTYLSMRFLMMFYIYTYIYTYVNEYIHIYTHTHTHTHTHAAFYFTICIKGVHNGEVAPLCPHISFLRLRDAHPSNLT